MEDIAFTEIQQVSNLLDLRITSLDGAVLKFQMTEPYARDFAERVLAQCDKLREENT